ncbi:pre-mRNA-splicing factor ATP-dependent RNA helicase prp22 [Wolfiporia cocos MD-104 SS10]|uniref:RNA helicase n=1 Tax=Wolfiporia cocos (strain MD-104) TaxID=742152 RepID=A0A2H3JC35_WOLCO|nr:pre-mRNA-splicing factor ATP-dependent RNA helicase prp22 [Wolfiporia cocos MD-104 SS10]
MAKKKKTQLKPVARGFATTSVPKKVIRVAEENRPSETVDPLVKEPANTAVDQAAEATPETVDPREQAAQVLVDKLQDKTEKEIVRTIVEQERRHAETFTCLDLGSTYIERVSALALQSSLTEPNSILEETEEKATARLGITYGVLRRLGFSEERVEECLKAIQGVDLEQAFDWLHLHCTDDELKGSFSALAEADDETLFSPTDYATSPKPYKRAQSWHKSTNSSRSSTPLSIKQTPARRFNADTLIVTHSSTTSSPVPGTHPSSSTVGDDIRSPISDHTGLSLASSGSMSPLDDPNAEYVRLQMQISDLTTHRQSGERRDATFLEALQRRLEEVKKDYLFDEEEAVAQFQIQRDKADAAALEARLRGTTQVPKIVDVAETSHASSTDIFDEDGDSPGGMFELLEMPSTVTTEQGTTVTVRDMTLPKHWSGRTPKDLLKERVHKVDRFATITYKDVSGTSRAKRAAVEIRWDSKRADARSMNDVACHSLDQAEQYISTVSLHSLTFPSSEGFAQGGTTTGAMPTSFRLLPPVYRDLWDELEKDRRSRDDAINRSIWLNLRAILESKRSRGSKASFQRGIKCSFTDQASKPTDVTAGRGTRYGGDVTPEQITANFQTMVANPSYQEMLHHRNQLPIAQYRSAITTTLETSQILVLSGETGCGKSTQVPAFVLEDQMSKGQHCKIFCTEPRRISAISLAQRVSQELGEPAGVVGSSNSIVGYSIRLESNITNRTRLAYVTNGIALRMLEGGTGQGGQGSAFDEITHIIVDEVHERSIESDFLLIVLKSLLQQRPDLKVILMSATVNAEKISDYFGGVPILQVPGRTFPVDVRYLEDAIELTRWEITENSPYARRHKDRFHRGKAGTEWSEDLAIGDDDDDDSTQDNVKLEKRYSRSTADTINRLDERAVPYDLIIKLLESICFKDPAYTPYSSAILIFMPGMGEIRKLNDMLMEHQSFKSEDRFKIHPLHSTISSEQQGAVFDLPPPGVRKIVIATNIAETGITIPDITCVIDTGKHKEMRSKRQISRLIETYVAKSNAAQRRGRAGRVQSGLCFHLFTKLLMPLNVLTHILQMAAHPDPEMMRLSLSDLALRIKVMKVKLGSSIEDVLLRALDPPLPVNIQRAVSVLVEVRALTPSEEITPMGRLLSKLPTDVHLGKFLLIATLLHCLDPALTIAATLNSKSPFVTPMGYEREADAKKLTYRIENSDFLTIHNAFSKWREACNNGIGRQYCRDNYLSYQNLQQIEELRQQFLGYLVDSSFIRVNGAFHKELSRARYSRGRTRFVNVPQELNANGGNFFLLNAALGAGLYPKILYIDPSTGSMKTITNNQAASFHPSSINFGRNALSFGASHLCYFTLMRLMRRQSKKLYAWETGPVDDVGLVLLCGEADFKLSSNTVLIDRKIRFRVPPKTGVALKVLRSQLSSLLATQMRIKPLDESQLLWNELAMMVLGKTKPKDPGGQESVTLVINR